MKIHILVIGATGQSGLDFITIALLAGHEITVYVRNPAKLDASVKDNPNVHIIEGDLQNEEALKKASSCGAKVFVSFAGPNEKSVGTPITNSLKILLPLLTTHDCTRALILGTVSSPAPEDLPSIKFRVSLAGLKLLHWNMFEEMQQLGALVQAQDATKLKWTLFRVPMLGNGPEKEVTATFTGTGRDGFFLNRKSMARWVLQEIEKGELSEWIGKAPVVSN